MSTAVSGYAKRMMEVASAWLRENPNPNPEPGATLRVPLRSLDKLRDPSHYSGRQRIAFLVGWDGWSDEIQQSIDHAIEARRTKVNDDETPCCLDCSVPLVTGDCRAGCTGGTCAECPLVKQGASRG